LGGLLAGLPAHLRAQDTNAAATVPPPVTEQLDVFFGEDRLLTLDRPIDDYTVGNDSVIKVEKVEGQPNEVSILGLAGGSSPLTVHSDGRTLVYDVSVSPAPERLYINLNESKRLTFPHPIDDTSVSKAGVVHLVQPDSANNVLLVEAVVEDKTTLTVYCAGQIYRYFISTFENRGADILEIENAFSAKGYRNLTITFDKDQAIIGGSVPTQEELDDAVHIVKQFTDYVVIKATLGQEEVEDETNEQEQIIINNIQRIANVPGLTVRVKFPAPTVITTSTYTSSVGDYIEPRTTTTPQGGTIRGSGFLPPTTSPSATPGTGAAGGANTAELEPKPQKNVTETTTTTKDTSIPEKIFLYGDLADDLQEARVIRVARTFCPFIVSFLTVKDPIQIRTRIRFMQVFHTNNRDTGVAWTGSGPEGGPTITLGFGSSTFTALENLNPATSLLNALSGAIGFTAATGTSTATEATLELYEALHISKLMRESQLFLTNGQPGWYSEGEVRSYVSGSEITASSPPIITETASSIFLGVNMDIAPLNITQSGGTEPTAQKIFGIPTSIGQGGATITIEQNSDNSADKISRLTAPIQKAGTAPILDDTVKYVDENGVIGMDIATQLTIPNGTFQTVTFGSQGAFLTLPDFFVRTTRTRVNLRDGQTVAINGLMDEQTTKSITAVPFLSSIPLLSSLFKNPVDSSSREEVIVLVTPSIIRMKDADSLRYPKPVYPETLDIAREQGDIPYIKPVRYDAGAIDLRPETPKDMKDTKDANAAAPSESDSLAPRASGGMQPQPLAPPTDSTPGAASPAVDKTKPSTDTSAPASSAPTLAPSSTLP
jgi:Flp pilus assembly secretin CpaC